MTNRELNEKTLELLRQKLNEEEETALVIAIKLNPKTEKFSQLVGYGISMPMITLAFIEAQHNLLLELALKGKS